MKQILLSSKKHWLPIAILIIGIVGAYSLYQTGKSTKTAPQIKKAASKKLSKKLRIVNSQALSKQTHYPVLFTTGVVKPSQQVELKPQVIGVINQINVKAIPGALLCQGEPLVSIDKQDLSYVLANKEALLVQAQSTLAIERGNQLLAEEEYAFMKNNAITSPHSKQEQLLVLRKPQIASARAKVKSAKANVAQAKLNVSRTNIVMPFTGTIVQRNIALASRVTTNTSLYKILKIERFDLSIKIPRSFLKVLDIEQAAIVSHRELSTVLTESLHSENLSTANVNSAKKSLHGLRKAKIVSVLPDLDARDRQVKLLVAIDDPFLQANAANGCSKPSTQRSFETPANTKDKSLIFINDFLYVKLTGKALQNTVKIKPQWLMPNGYIWVVAQNNTLQKRQVNVVFRGKKFLYITGDFPASDEILTDRLAIATIGMPVKKRRSMAATSTAITELKNH